MQAIKTIFYGPTNTKSSRMGASCQAMSLSVAYDHGLTLAENHKRACDMLVERLKLPYKFIPGEYKGDVYWVAAP